MSHFFEDECAFQTLLAAAFAGHAKERTIAFENDNGDRDVRTRASLAEDARAFARALVQNGVGAKSPLLIALPTGPDFVVAFLGALYAGAYPVPIGLPAGFGDLSNFTRRVGAIGSFLGASALVTGAGLKDAALAELPTARFIDPGARVTDADGKIALPDIQSSDIALLQCTSGSTGLPKAVALTHGNLLANVHQIGRGVEVRDSDVVVSWLPLNHDMGLIGCFLFSLYWGLDLVLLPPTRFLRRPSSWLKAIAAHRGTLSPAPNFAYAYASSRVKDEELEGVDLSSWRVAFCGAEPIDVRTLDGFTERFRSFGLRPDVVLPCYGLAEASLAVTFHPAGTPFHAERLDREAFANSIAAAAAPDATNPITVVSCGRPLAGTEVRILGRDGVDAPEGSIGTIHVRGPSVMQGYFKAEETTARVLKDGWLDTGDLGYLRGGLLYVTGREKDVIILRGKCYAPTEFEWPACEITGIRKGSAVAFGAYDPKAGTELLHVVCETDVHDDGERDRLREEVAKRIAARSGVRPDVVRLVRRDAVPKTTSGKVQRSKTKTLCAEERPSCAWSIA